MRKCERGICNNLHAIDDALNIDQFMNRKVWQIMLKQFPRECLLNTHNNIHRLFTSHKIKTSNCS